MKINRLIGIITVLQQKGKVTAPYLAEKFEVSRRTINRDIEDICSAGIPIVTTQGANGGISIMEGFNIDTTVFSTDELQSIFVGLKALDSVSDKSQSAILSQKICSKNNVFHQMDDISIDLASFYKDSFSQKISLLKTAIKEKKCVRFHYYYNKGEADKLIEPYHIVYKWSDWYIVGFCRERQDFRTYKLTRLWNLSLTNDIFTYRNIPDVVLNIGNNIVDNIIVTAIYDYSMKYRLVEEYSPDCFTVTDSGLLAKIGFSSYENALTWFLAFGSNVKVIEPEDFRNLLIAETEKILSNYKNNAKT